MSSTRLLSILTALILLATAVGSGHAACDGVVHESRQSGPWQLDEFFDTQSHQPLTVTLEISITSANTRVQYFDGTQWIDVTDGATVEGTKTRFRDGEVVIHYLYQGCDEEVQPSDT